MCDSVVPLLTIRELDFSLGPICIEKLNLRFFRGEIVCLVGNNGAGKSTFLRLCAGLIEPASGAILSPKGHELQGMNFSARSRELAYLPQSAFRAEGTSALRFVALADELDRFLHARDGLQMNEIRHYLSCLSLFDAEHLAQRDVSTLSGGEWTRVQLARVWAQDVPLMLLDEPDTGLDLGHKKLLVKRCRDQVGGGERGIVMTSHDINLVCAVATRVLVMHQGRVIFLGAPQEALDSKVFERELGVEFVRLGSSGSVVAPQYEAVETAEIG